MTIRLGLLAWIVAAAVAAVPTMASAAVASFIWFDGEQGNSTDAHHKGWFEIKELSLATQHASSVGSASSGAGAGKAKFNEFTIKRVTDSASPTFFRKALTTGKHFSTVKIEMHKAGGKPNEMVNYVFSNVAISKIDLGGSGDRGPEESITFVYGSMAIQYSSQAAGSDTPPAATKVLPSSAHTPQPSR